MLAASTQGVRPVVMTTPGQPTSDGAGVKLTRMIGTQSLHTLDPFLMLDFFATDKAQDYIAGFPEHPHRGFDTVTYMLAGRMRHRDNHGHEGVIEAGGVQWMTAGRGIVHSEMPEQREGLMKGFQLWVNLPARLKMTPPTYAEFDASEIPNEQRGGASLRVIAGTTSSGMVGPVQAAHVDARYFDVTLPAGETLKEPLPDGHNAILVVFEGAIAVAGQDVRARSLAVLGREGSVEVSAGVEGARFLLISGRPIGEPVAWGGPFVMNTEAEVRQAFADYRSGRF